MQLQQLSQQVQAIQKSANRLAALMKQLSKLEQNRAANLRKIKDTLQQMTHVAAGLDGVAECAKNLRSWLEGYQTEIEGTQREFRSHFGIELERELQKQGLSLSGHYPELKSGLFTIELDFDKWQVILWYGPKQERLSQCGVSSVEVAKKISELRGQLGSHVNEEEFLKRLYRAYQRTLMSKGSKEGASVPIIEVLSEAAYLLQEPRFHQDPRREHYKGYSRADFSYDLFRVRRLEPSDLFRKKLHLVVATRAFTRRRRDFLWVPDDETGKGTVYSHLKFEEVK